MGAAAGRRLPGRKSIERGGYGRCSGTQLQGDVRQSLESDRSPICLAAGVGGQHVGQFRGGQVGTSPRPDGNRMFFERTNSYSVSTAFSRPKPLPLTPPNGEPRNARRM